MKCQSCGGALRYPPRSSCQNPSHLAPNGNTKDASSPSVMMPETEFTVSLRGVSTTVTDVTLRPMHTVRITPELGTTVTIEFEVVEISRTERL